MECAEEVAGGPIDKGGESLSMELTCLSRDRPEVKGRGTRATAIGIDKDYQLDSTDGREV